MNSSNWGQDPINQSTISNVNGTISGEPSGQNSIKDSVPANIALQLNATSIIKAIDNSLNGEFPVSVSTLKLFFIIAIPLAIVAVLLPLCILPLFSYFARKASFPNIRKTVIWSWVFITFSLNVASYPLLLLWARSERFVNTVSFTVLAVIVFGTLSVMSLSFLVHIIGFIWWLVEVSRNSGLLRSLRRCMWLIILWLAWIILYYYSFLVGWMLEPAWLGGSLLFFGTLFPYMVIFGYQIFRCIKRRRKIRHLASYENA